VVVFSVKVVAADVEEYSVEEYSVVTAVVINSMEVPRVVVVARSDE
jgi:hypothetical protein